MYSRRAEGGAPLVPVDVQAGWMRTIGRMTKSALCSLAIDLNSFLAGNDRHLGSPERFYFTGRPTKAEFEANCKNMVGEVRAEDQDAVRVIFEGRARSRSPRRRCTGNYADEEGARQAGFDELLKEALGMAMFAGEFQRKWREEDPGGQERYWNYCRANGTFNAFQANPLAFILANRPACCWQRAAAFVRQVHTCLGTCGQEIPRDVPPGADGPKAPVAPLPPPPVDVDPNRVPVEVVPQTAASSTVVDPATSPVTAVTASRILRQSGQDVYTYEMLSLIHI